MATDVPHDPTNAAPKAHEPKHKLFFLLRLAAASAAATPTVPGDWHGIAHHL